MSKSDKELLELAIKAAGYTDIKQDESGFYRVIGEHEDGRLCMVQWNPLNDDGDALRLAVKLGLRLLPYPIYETEKHSMLIKQCRKSDTMREQNETEIGELYGNDMYAATRRAIVRSAAAIGEQLSNKQSLKSNQ